MDNKELFDKLAGFAKTAYQYKGDITADTPFDELGKESMKMIALPPSSRTSSTSRSPSTRS